MALDLVLPGVPAIGPGGRSHRPTHTRCHLVGCDAGKCARAGVPTATSNLTRPTVILTAPNIHAGASPHGQACRMTEIMALAAATRMQADNAQAQGGLGRRSGSSQPPALPGSNPVLAGAITTNDAARVWSCATTVSRCRSTTTKWWANPAR
jgi:hypothetical protein